MELSDKVQVTLTKEGAEYLISRNEESRSRAKKWAPAFSVDQVERCYPLNYHDQQVITMTLKEVFTTFNSALVVGGKVPFTNLVPVDKRCSSRKGARSCQVQQPSYS